MDIDSAFVKRLASAWCPAFVYGGQIARKLLWLKSQPVLNRHR
ncbi:hypothetical protein ACQVBX_17905 [Dyella sp. KULCS107]